MTLLQSNLPVIEVEEAFRLEYHGTYGKVEWEGTHPFVTIEEGPLPIRRFRWDSRDYLGNMEAKEAKLVPFDLVRLYWGDPRSVPSNDGKPIFGRTENSKGEIGDIAPREVEVRRLCCLYGLGEANAHLLGEAVPNVTITNAADVEIICPAFDPEGKHLYGFREDSTPNYDLATQIAHLKNRLAQLEDAGRNGKSNDGSDVTDDKPPRTRQSV